MTLTLDLDTLLGKITTISGAISGIRHAYDYDEAPDAPPGMFNRGQAMHLTGFPEEGEGWLYRRLGIDMNEWEITVPLYTVVLAATQIKRSRSWVEPYPQRYAAAFATNIQLGGLIAAGSALYTGARIVRSIPEAPGYDGFYMLRHTVELHLKGHVDQSA